MKKMILSFSLAALLIGCGDSDQVPYTTGVGSGSGGALKGSFSGGVASASTSTPNTTCTAGGQLDGRLQAGQVFKEEIYRQVLVAIVESYTTSETISLIDKTHQTYFSKSEADVHSTVYGFPQGAQWTSNKCTAAPLTGPRFSLSSNEKCNATAGSMNFAAATTTVLVTCFVRPDVKNESTTATGTYKMADGKVVNATTEEISQVGTVICTNIGGTHTLGPGTAKIQKVSTTDLPSRKTSCLIEPEVIVEKTEIHLDENNVLVTLSTKELTSVTQAPHSLDFPLPGN